MHGTKIYWLEVDVIAATTQLGEQSVLDRENKQELGFLWFTVHKKVAYNSSGYDVSLVTMNTNKMRLVHAHPFAINNNK